MVRFLEINGENYELEKLSEPAMNIYSKVLFCRQALAELSAEQAFLLRAKNAYIEDLKTEVIEKKSGVDLGALFGDD